MKVLILTPRLDVMFKRGPVPVERGPIAPIRVHWQRFAEGAAKEHRKRGDKVHVLELPNWQFTPELVCKFKPDIAYIPHKESHSFPIPDIENIDVRYYMQTVFPWRFYVDPVGFAGGSSIDGETLIEMGEDSSSEFEKLRAYSQSGGTKFDQPDRQEIELPEDYIFFPCQIPHDETIKYHSSVTVPQALLETIETARMMGVKLIVKGHPVNPGSMAPLKKIADEHSHVIWVDNVNIHDLIPNALSVVVVNSGTGMESLLQYKKVFTFGRAEYNCVANSVSDSIYNLYYLMQQAKVDEIRIRKFFDGWCRWTIDTTDETDFSKLY